MGKRGVNKVILLGNLGNDPEVRYMPNGDAVANVSLATSESWKDQSGAQQEKTEWHRLVFYRKLAEIVGHYIKKGSRIYVEGNLKTRKWQDQQGNDKYTTEITVTDMQMLGGNEDGAQVNNTEQHNTQQRQPNQRNHKNQYGSAKSPEQMKAAGQMPEPDFDFDDDLPF